MPKQPELNGISGPGVAPVSIPEVNVAMEAYILSKETHKITGDRHKANTKVLIDLMRQHKEEIGVDNDGTILYRHDDEVAILKEKDDLKVTNAPEVT